MLFPNLTCIDNFLDDPDKVIELSKKFEYSNCLRSPGSRTEHLFYLDFEFFNWINLKICSVFYPMEITNIRFGADTFFQRTKKLEHDNWVHEDDVRFTAILYLNKEDTAGTSIFKPVGFGGQDLDQRAKLKYDYFINENNDLPDDKIKLIGDTKQENNAAFVKTASAEGIYNRLVIFDGNTYHASNPMDTEHERLTLISFIKDITINGKPIEYPVPKMKTI